MLQILYHSLNICEDELWNVDEADEFSIHLTLQILYRSLNTWKASLPYEFFCDKSNGVNA